jgi:hypothetical protein
MFNNVQSAHNLLETVMNAFECNVIEYRFFGKIKIHFLNLYIGDIHLEDSKNQEINKVMFQISYVTVIAHPKNLF